MENVLYKKRLSFSICTSESIHICRRKSISINYKNVCPFSYIAFYFEYVFFMVFRYKIRKNFQFCISYSCIFVIRFFHEYLKFISWGNYFCRGIRSNFWYCYSIHSFKLNQKNTKLLFLAFLIVIHLPALLGSNINYLSHFSGLACGALLGLIRLQMSNKSIK